MLRSQGVVGEICGCYFDSNGHFCDTEMLKRTIAVPFETLRRVPLVIAVASGVAKAEAIVGALRTGVVKVLITDELCAQAILHYASNYPVVESPE
jgi:DNA-binding transcriptional regulator LsrR (DeoR family)